MNAKNLNKKEKAILEQFESGQFKQVKSVEKEKAKYQQYAKRTLSKPRTISIRVSERDLQQIKVLAAEKGLPYQTFISSLLHQHSSRKVK